MLKKKEKVNEEKETIYYSSLPINAEMARLNSKERDARFKVYYQKDVERFLNETYRKIREASMSEENFTRNRIHIIYHGDENYNSAAWGYIMSEIADRLREKGFRVSGESGNFGIAFTISW